MTKKIGSIKRFPMLFTWDEEFIKTFKQTCLDENIKMTEAVSTALEKWIEEKQKKPNSLKLKGVKRLGFKGVR